MHIRSTEFKVRAKMKFCTAAINISRTSICVHIPCCYGNGKRIYTSSKFNMIYNIRTMSNRIAIPPAGVRRFPGIYPSGLRPSRYILKNLLHSRWYITDIHLLAPDLYITYTTLKFFGKGLGSGAGLGLARGALCCARGWED